jgi:hypothetical protein
VIALAEVIFRSDDSAFGTDTGSTEVFMDASQKLIVDLGAILEQKTSPQRKLKVLEIIRQCLAFKDQRFSDEVAKRPAVLKAIIEVFRQHPNANLLHFQAEKILTKILEGQEKSIKQALLKEANFLITLTEMAQVPQTWQKYIRPLSLP